METEIESLRGEIEELRRRVITKECRILIQEIQPPESANAVFLMDKDKGIDPELFLKAVGCIINEIEGVNDDLRYYGFSDLVIPTSGEFEFPKTYDISMCISFSGVFKKIKTECISIIEKMNPGCFGDNRSKHVK